MSSPTLAQRIERVLTKHELYQSDYYTWWNHAKLVNDLAALSPTPPSREALHGYLHDNATTLGQYRTLERDVQERLVETMFSLAWATGTPSQSEWVIAEGDIWLHQPCGQLVGEPQRYCAICGKPRPR